MAPTGSQYRLGSVLPEQLPDKWGVIVKLVDKWLANTFGEYILTDVYRLIETGEWQCWTVSKDRKLVALALTTITPRPRMKIMQIVGVAGKNYKDWVHLLEEVEDWAKINGCSRILGCGRVGWDRVMAPHGFRKMYSVIGKDL